MLLGIAGEPGAGKTTLAEDLVAALRARHGAAAVAHLPMDGFHLADTQLRRLGLLDRKGAPDTFDVGGYRALLERVRLSTGEPVYAPGFERTLEQPLAAALFVDWTARIVVSEGNYLLLDTSPWRQVRALFDEVWFVALDEGERLRRLVARHTEFGKAPEAARAWATGSDEDNARLVRATSCRADLVVDAPA